MSERNDGGPAFPADFRIGQIGMSLRDWFAGQAIEVASAKADSGMQDYTTFKKYFGNRICITRAEIIAAVAYDIADAMLAERSK